MKKIILILLLVFISTVFTLAQSTENDNNTDVGGVAVNTGRLLLREVTISSFEDPTEWDVNISVDKGYSESRRIVGSPKEKTPLKIEDQINGYNPSDTYVLGAKFGFYARDLITLSITSKEPLFLPGIVKQLSVWVAGRGKEHDLSAVIRDMEGNIYTLPLGKLNFSGWNRMEIAVPGDLVQKDVYGLHGLYFLGFKINTSFEDSVGIYYIYFDDMRIVSDVIDEVINAESEDDIGDGW